jgi:hypothetical protein
MSGIKRSGNRPRTAKHLRSQSSKTFVNRSKEDREREHAMTDTWAERERVKRAEEDEVYAPRMVEQ